MEIKLETCGGGRVGSKCQLSQTVLWDYDQVLIVPWSKQKENLMSNVSLERIPTRGCKRWTGFCGGSGCGRGCGFCCSGNDGWKARLCVSSAESFRSQSVIRFEADHHRVATGLHWLWQLPSTEFIFK